MAFITDKMAPKISGNVAKNAGKSQKIISKVGKNEKKRHQSYHNYINYELQKVNPDILMTPQAMNLTNYLVNGFVKDILSVASSVALGNNSTMITAWEVKSAKKSPLGCPEGTLSLSEDKREVADITRAMFTNMKAITDYSFSK